MNTNGINNSLPYVYTSPFASTGASTSAIQNKGATSPVSAQGVQTHQDSDGGNRAGLAQNVMQALNQSGINLSSASGTQKQALHQLMHDIFQAVQQGSATSQPTPPKSSTQSASAGYDHVSSNLQSLVQQLSTSSSNGNGQNSALTKLQTDFNSLVQSVGGASATQGSASLQNFLGNLSNDLSAQGSSKPASGSLINITA